MEINAGDLVEISRLKRLCLVLSTVDPGCGVVPYDGYKSWTSSWLHDDCFPGAPNYILLGTDGSIMRVSLDRTKLNIIQSAQDIEDV